MSTSATWTAQLVLAGDDPATKTYTAAMNPTSPSYDQLINLASGANTLTAPTAAIPTRLTIVPPVGNAVALTLKGATGDTGVPISKVDPTSIGLDPSVVTLCLTAGALCNGVRLIWS